MTMSLNDDIEQLVARLESEPPPEDAYFAIFQYGEGPEESYIKAGGRHY